MDGDPLHGATDNQIDVADERQLLRFANRDETPLDDAVVLNASSGLFGADLRSAVPVIGFNESDRELAHEHSAALADILLGALVRAKGVAAV